MLSDQTFPGPVSMKTEFPEPTSPWSAVSLAELIVVSSTSDSVGESAAVIILRTPARLDMAETSTNGLGVSTPLTALGPYQTANLKPGVGLPPFGSMSSLSGVKSPQSWVPEGPETSRSRSPSFHPSSPSKPPPACVVRTDEQRERSINATRYSPYGSRPTRLTRMSVAAVVNEISARSFDSGPVGTSESVSDGSDNPDGVKLSGLFAMPGLGRSSAMASTASLTNPVPIKQLNRAGLPTLRTGLRYVRNPIRRPNWGENSIASTAIIGSVSQVPPHSPDSLRGQQEDQILRTFGARGMAEAIHIPAELHTTFNQRGWIWCDAGLMFVRLDDGLSYMVVPRRTMPHLVANNMGPTRNRQVWSLPQAWHLLEQASDNNETVVEARRAIRTLIDHDYERVCHEVVVRRMRSTHSALVVLHRYLSDRGRNVYVRTNRLGNLAPRGEVLPQRSSRGVAMDLSPGRPDLAGTPSSSVAGISSFSLAASPAGASTTATPKAPMMWSAPRPGPSTASSSAILSLGPKDAAPEESVSIATGWIVRIELMSWLDQADHGLFEATIVWQVGDTPAWNCIKLDFAEFADLHRQGVFFVHDITDGATARKNSGLGDGA
ncbi:hypothetical protein A1O1_07978 [Capronia coronata CBS 617.96]|uniref:Uncharacterized protein n=1 Tax=Capronia coronata CBS 617.96 TaxID=1182541 RepID=W9XY95_9EURO|nr:uncharacterized protein A1O1_07978 [Capronia coronata CBS 617.96]EXJ81911.1 hypothetical protein A1O1_07978 [Capronia coronata CBS 617.96]